MRGKTTLLLYEGKRMTLREVAEAQGMAGEKGYQAFRKWHWRRSKRAGNSAGITCLRASELLSGRPEFPTNPRRPDAHASRP